VPITVTVRCKAWSVFARSNTGIVVSNPTWGMDVCVRLFCVCVVLYAGSGLGTVWSPVQGVLPAVLKIKKTGKAANVQQRAVEPWIDSIIFVFLHAVTVYILSSVIHRSFILILHSSNCILIVSSFLLTQFFLISSIFLARGEGWLIFEYKMNVRSLSTSSHLNCSGRSTNYTTNDSCLCEQ
jgi:hypothetical protein